MVKKLTYEKLEQRVKELEKRDAERMRMEGTLRESEERFRAVYEGCLDAILLADPESGKIVDVNPSTCSLFSSPFEKLVGLHHSQLYPSRLQKAAMETFAIKTQDKDQDCPIESVILCSDGNEKPVEILAQLIQIDGTPLLYMGFREIRDRKRLEEELQESEERFRKVIETAPDGIGVTDLEGNITYVSPQMIQLYGFRTEDEMVGRHITEIIAEEDRGRVPRTIQKTIASGIIKGIEYLFLKGDGTTFLGELSLSVVMDARDEQTGFIGVLRDITERRRMEEEITRTGRLESLGILAGGLAHDFNNLLTPILVNISMAKTYRDFDPEIAEMLTDVEKASLRARGLTQQLLTFAKGGAPIKKTIYLSRFLEAIVRFALSGSNVRCEYAISDDLWPLEVDEGQISQVIHNIVINADQAMAEGGIIKIRAENLILAEEEHVNLEGGRYVRISIEDQGHGIPREQLSKIFDPFFTIKEQGRGLGLSTSLSIVTRHKGQIHVDSKMGVGTIFHIYLPTSEKKPEIKEKAKDKPIKGKGKVLLIDDEEIIRKSARGALKRLGYHVQAAKDHVEGIRLYEKAMKEKHPFQAVIMDLTIPGSMGGQDAIKKLKKIDRDARVIVSSGYSDDRVMSKFREYGFCGVVVKPYEIEELARVIHNVIKGVDG